MADPVARRPTYSRPSHQREWTLEERRRELDRYVEQNLAKGRRLIRREPTVAEFEETSGEQRSSLWSLAGSGLLGWIEAAFREPRPEDAHDWDNLVITVNEYGTADYSYRKPALTLRRQVMRHRNLLFFAFLGAMLIVGFLISLVR